MKLEKTDDRVPRPTTPFAGSAIGRKKTDVSRKRAGRIIRDLFGPRVFLMGKSGTEPGKRKSIGQRLTGQRTRVIGRGKTWLEAVLEAAKTLGHTDIANAAQELYSNVTTGANETQLHKSSAEGSSPL